MLSRWSSVSEVKDEIDDGIEEANPVEERSLWMKCKLWFLPPQTRK